MPFGVTFHSIDNLSSQPCNFKFLEEDSTLAIGIIST